MKNLNNQYTMALNLYPDKTLTKYDLALDCAMALAKLPAETLVSARWTTKGTSPDSNTATVGVQVVWRNTETGDLGTFTRQIGLITAPTYGQLCQLATVATDLLTSNYESPLDYVEEAVALTISVHPQDSDYWRDLQSSLQLLVYNNFYETELDLNGYTD